MTISHVRRVVTLHERAEQHADQYKRLSIDPSAQSKALEDQRKADRLYSQVSELIRDFARGTV